MKNIKVFNYNEKYFPKSDNYGTLKINNSKKICNTTDLVEALDSGSGYSLECLDGINVYKGIYFDNTLQTFRLDFFDDFGALPLSTYLKDEESDFRLTRVDDDVIIGLSKNDLKRFESKIYLEKTYKKTLRK